MSTKISIPHDAIVFVGDGRKALFLRNAGDEKFPNLKIAQPITRAPKGRVGYSRVQPPGTSAAP
jgi:protein required for attachment to host cells